MLNKKDIAIIGSGFAGLAAAAVLGSCNKKVDVFEKNNQIGGRARQFRANGFTFDMGPSWYWMPDVIERFFNRFDHSTTDFFELKKLDPGFQIIFEEGYTLKVPAGWEALCTLFENIENGASHQLEKFMADAEYKYRVSMADMAYMPGVSIGELFRPRLLKGIFKLNLFFSFQKHVRKYFKSEILQGLMEFPVLFLGAMPSQTPAIYSLMNYAGLKLGTYYPVGGFRKLVEAMRAVGEENGVYYHLSDPVKELQVSGRKVVSIRTGNQLISVDGVVGSADYCYVEQSLLAPEYRNYDKKYWDKKVFAPSCLLFFLGVNKKIEKLLHHNLFFDKELEHHAREIYCDKKWPSNPLFYVCCPSKTDSGVAPDGMENVFVLMPIAPGLPDTDTIRQSYYTVLMERLEDYTGIDIRNHIIYRRSYCIKDFVKDYHAYNGNAYGLANTLRQTANLKPSIRSRKLTNLVFAGQLTVPGPGVPPSIISGQIAADELLKILSN